MSEWQPIETAPRDGTPVFLSGEGKYNGRAHQFLIAALWNRDEEDWDELDLVFGAFYYGSVARSSGTPVDRNVTHWMPLPDPPK